MRRHLVQILHNIPALRVVCVVASLLFIPAFQYGFVSVWAIIFGILTALLFDRYLQHIIDICEPIEDKVKRCKSVLTRYALLTVEIAMIGSLGAIIFLYIDFGENHVVRMPDALFMDFSPLGIFYKGDYVDDNLGFQILTSIINSILVWICVAPLISRHRLNDHMKLIVYGKKVKEYYGGIENQKRAIQIKAIYRAISGLFYFWSFGPLIYTLMIYRDIAILEIMRTSLFVICGWLIITWVLYTMFLSEKGFERV